ncbi:MAG: hypothetical protein II649_05620 [Kiritimatiellae bacterium]|nr:hypothetical protein [Kiritimatiellia bacterium]
MPNCRIEGATPFRRFALDELGAGEVRFAVTPINCFGARGKPLVSAWYDIMSDREKKDDVEQSWCCRPPWFDA